MKKLYACLLFIFVFALSPTAARAVCTLPNGDHGDMLYNLDHTVMQYCNGTKWISMDASKSGGSDNLGNHTATKDLDMTAHKIVNAAVPTSSADVTNKAYVDAAVASAAGSGGGGGGATCYYTNSNCGSGFDQMPGQYGGSNICCTGGGSLVDEMPSAFDFPASPAIAGTAGHTWSPLEISGFESASVSISTTAGSGLAEFRICADSACSNVLKGWRNTSTGIASGNYLQIRIGAHTNTRSSNAKVTVTVGGMTDDARITSPISGDYFLAFVTNQSFNGSLGGVAGADTKCQSAATAAGLGGTFMAWIASDNGNIPANRFANAGTTAAFYMPNGSGGGVKLVDNWADLVDGSLDSTFSRTENGTAMSGSYIWTDLNYDGTLLSSGYSCNNWNNATSTYNGYIGRTNQTSSGWSYYTSDNCTYSHSLYCFQTALPN